MSRLDEHRQKIVAKLTSARSEIEDALNLARHAAPHGSAFVPEMMRSQWAAMIADLNHITSQLEDEE